MPNSDEAKGALIFVANAQYKKARWWQLACAWVFGRHQIVRHLGREGRVSFWRGKPYLLSFRETP
ncbi:hypothetical protein M3484_04975 [Pseudomonas sp. GX19020]|uniref:hypothetical protein n=1 Tax=Pseudomonas sp. GX19020 TaxID=2942277 RepID=UPI002019C3DA|nr:hypothetical protein [Pseudomonas sp. GX19020]MCL4065914.1 hypothetical protein [Pseudomonas sp. GX19020]